MDPYPSASEDVPASQIYMGKDVRKYGLLKKKSGGKKIPLIQDKYDQRFVIINKGWVYYYKDKSSEKPQGKFSLQGFSNTVINAEEEEATMPYVFKIYNKKANERTWYFATEIKLDMEQWMEAFRLEIEQYNVRGVQNIRLIKSCPVKPLHSPQSTPHLDISNDRPQSAHTQAPMHESLVGSQFSSRTDITSGIGSSTQSIDEYFYEPVHDGYDGEATDSSCKSLSPRHQFSPHERKALSPLPLHIERSAPVGPEDLPARPPPAPPESNPSPFQHVLSPTNPTLMHNIPAYSKNGTNIGAPRHSSSGPEIPRNSPTAISQNRFSPLPSYPTYPQTQVPPALPPKPSTPNDLSRNTHFGFGMPPLKPHPPNEQYAYYPDNYDDTAELSKSVVDTIDTGLEPGDIEEIIYEQEEMNSKPLPPTPPLKPGKKINMVPLLPQKPAAKQPARKVDEQSGTGNSWRSGLTTSNCTNLNGKMMAVVENGTKPKWQPKLRSPTSPHEAAAGNKPPNNMVPLLPQKPAAKQPALRKVDQQSGTANSGKSGLATSNCPNLNGKMVAVIEHSAKPKWQPKLRSTTLSHEVTADNNPPWLTTKLRTAEGSKVAAATTSAVCKAESRSSWVKDPTDAVSQKSVDISKTPLHKEQQQPGKKIIGYKVPTSGVGSKPSTSMQPSSSQKPELSKAKPALIKLSPHKPIVRGNKPPTPQKSKPSVAQTSHVANLLDRFSQQ